MPETKLEECLRLLRQADAILLAEQEDVLACHLSLVIELLAEKLATRPVASD
jgi:hypothetical protein